MEPFYLIVLAIATIVLILLLTFIGSLMNKKNSKDIFPPVSNSCPDGWTHDAPNNACLFGTTNMGYQTDGTVNTASTLITAIDNFNTTKDISYKTDGTVTGIKLDPVGSNPIWTVTGFTSTCAQKSWSNQNSILWDGVSNYNSC